MTPQEPRAEPRSFNDIGQEIVDMAPQAEVLVEEWFTTLTAVRERLGPAFGCRFCKQPPPDEWGSVRRCPEHPKKRTPPLYMRTCEFVRVA
jgi:hypothetical protein